MPNQVSEYKNRTISITVYGPHGRGAYTGSFVITSRDGDADVDQQFTPTWAKPVFTEDDAFSALKRVARGVIDGKCGGDEVGSG